MPSGLAGQIATLGLVDSPTHFPQANQVSSISAMCMYLSEGGVSG